jgi:valyl-tRNA synthetase
MIADWPTGLEDYRDTQREQQIARMQDLIKAIRNTRNEYRVDEKATVTVSVKCTDAIAKELEVHAGEELSHALIISKLVDYLGGDPTVTSGSVTALGQKVTLFGASVVMTPQDRERLDGLLAAVEAQRTPRQAGSLPPGVVSDSFGEVATDSGPFALNGHQRHSQNNSSSHS